MPFISKLDGLKLTHRKIILLKKSKEVLGKKISLIFLRAKVSLCLPELHQTNPTFKNQDAVFEINNNYKTTGP